MSVSIGTRATHLRRLECPGVASAKLAHKQSVIGRSLHVLSGLTLIAGKLAMIAENDIGDPRLESVAAGK